MKANREHRVPLCRRAVEVLDAARTLSDGDRPLVFTIGGGEPLEETVRRRLLERQRVAAVPHGFRSSFRDWAAEETEHRRESSRRRWHTSSRTRSKRRTRGRTCSSAGGC